MRYLFLILLVLTLGCAPQGFTVGKRVKIKDTDVVGTLSEVAANATVRYETKTGEVKHESFYFEELELLVEEPTP